MKSRWRSCSARGVALVLVLWVIAALTVLVSGLVAAQRSELSLIASERGRLQASAIGAAAIAQVLQAQTPGAVMPVRMQRLTVRQADAEVEVEVMPLNGLIDLNLAPAPLLTALWRDLGQRDDADELTVRLMARRQPSAEAAKEASAAASGALSRLEQILTLPGFDPDLVSRIRPFVTTGSGGSGRVNPLAAPFQVLKLLASGDEALAQRISNERDAGAAMIDTTRLDGNFIDTSGSNRLRLTARVLAADGTRFEVRRSVEVGRATQPGAAPWRVLDDAVTRVSSDNRTAPR